ncbi:VOC family protein [Clavibacter michiganensis]|uniref:Glyoxalase n=1 Tax=Clavibacter michiganensis subsp. insidiosus TaxID=33014 RepID=A0A0D5CIE8_9MICO|nr:VOC family protein [Clavibacter michiganensis]AJW79037.1 glyoxalase [Clavibacter michiganensis subsp. insidiosus]AWF98269.1 glyoxalase [Clavibacter michiganensis subsp. insidiosus]AWG01530.1 glyoxalase [Clavibacter michiganensis subsp. insidiosus]OQJ59941.1 glyoxalase [Clavibacter michiganensis subsp. insidiosus]RII86598.1 VOC family protein [Clavibacter michiganensis subsp. insidiosus]
MPDLLSADTTMGPVTLLVGDLDRMTAYYRDAVGLEQLDEGTGSTTLGRGGAPAVVLEPARGLDLPSPGNAGLFHTAVLFDEPAALARSVASLAQRAPGTFAGSADHLVSRAFYFTDPEGNGVELYTDRPRDEWTWQDGRVVMDSLRLDPNAFLRDELAPVADAASDAAGIGHVHLQVGDTETAGAFYVDTLGFELVAGWHGSAIFVSAGGYHHHMAMNTWNSRGAGRRPATLGLGTVRIEVPTRDEVVAVDARLRAAGVATRDDGRSLAFEDPWGNALVLSAA